jgi:hypothetical protein
MLSCPPVSQAFALSCLVVGGVCLKTLQHPIDRLVIIFREARAAWLGGA